MALALLGILLTLSAGPSVAQVPGGRGEPCPGGDCFFGNSAFMTLQYDIVLVDREATPAAVVRSAVPPRITSPKVAADCQAATPDNTGSTMQCIVRSMATDREIVVHDCNRDNGRPDDKAACVAGRLGSGDGKKLADDYQECRKQGEDGWDGMAKCLAERNTGGEAQRVVACMRETQKRNDYNFTAVATCYGGKLLDFNAELQVAVQCAVKSGGEPISTATCTAGELTSRELAKCKERTAGQPGGCFGPDNTIVKMMNQLGLNLGPGNDAYKVFNSHVGDLLQGPGRNNDAVRVVNQVNRELENGAKAVTDAVNAALANLRPKVPLPQVPRIPSVGEILGHKYF